MGYVRVTRENRKVVRKGYRKKQLMGYVRVTGENKKWGM
jgi:hypothetical protein